FDFPILGTVTPTVTPTVVQIFADTAPREGNSTPGKFNLMLNTPAPASGLTVNYTVASGGNAATPVTDYTPLTGSVTFTPGSTTAAIALNPIDDNIAEADESITLILNQSSNYNIGNSNRATLTISDNDSPGITIAPIAGLITTETGGTANFSIKLNSQPTADVRINLFSTNPREGNLSTSSVNFTPANWNIPQTVTVIGLNDNRVDGSIPYRIFTAPAISNDSAYNGLDSPDVLLTNLTSDFGIFKVGNTGRVSIDFLYDGGWFQGEMAIFDLRGMENLIPGSPDFIREAAGRAIAFSRNGNVVISDPWEGARFNGNMWGDNHNSGRYLGIKNFPMLPGAELAIMLVPHGTVMDVFNNPNIDGSRRPFFSVLSAGQIVDVTGEGNTFAWEDLPLNGGSDRDYNDIIFQIKGATVNLPQMKDLIQIDWRNLPLGREILDYARNGSVTNPPPIFGNSRRLIRGVNGWYIDGYIAGGQVFFDGNKNGIRDGNEPGTISDRNGAFKLDISLADFDTNGNEEIDAAEGNLVAVGGTDTATGLPQDIPLTAPVDAAVITLLTSLVTDLIDKGMSSYEAETKVQNALQIPEGVDITSLDPIAAIANNQVGGVETLREMSKVQNFITQTMNLLAGSLPEGTTASNYILAKTIVGTIGDRILSNLTLDMSNADQITTLLTQAVANTKQLYPSLNPVVDAQFIAKAANIMAEANQRIDIVAAATQNDKIAQQIARIQKISLGEISLDFKLAASGTKSIDAVLSENTGSNLDSQIAAIQVSNNPGLPIINPLPKFDYTKLFDPDYYLEEYSDVKAAVDNKVFSSAFEHFTKYGYAEGRNPNGLFATDYLNHNPDVKDAVSKGVFRSGYEHFRLFGIKEGRLFAPEYNALEILYRSQNQDVDQAVRDGRFSSGIEHLLKFGFAEGRNPIPEYNAIAEIFDSTYYLGQNIDVAKAVNRGELSSAWEHFVKYGMFEQRDPSLMFSNSIYLAQNQDVAAAVSGGIFRSGFEHYRQFGFKEQRKINLFSL
ncbi:MAG TPA: hypothetical protein DCY88_33915, partial [Cyanobacteria bacterium UBA11372]|nr:hypothetical protein [Cyanobacteria bacterium UBA11372]